MNFRIKAFLSHLSISLIIACFSAYLVLYVWHPAPLAKAVGVTSIFLVMLAIDSILGPLLTLAVAKEGKKSLKFDLSVIAIVQAAALMYGLYTISLSRPVYIAYNKNQFEVIQANNIVQESLEKADAPYNKNNWGQYTYVATIQGTDEESVPRDASQRPNFYEPLANQHDAIQDIKFREYETLIYFNSDEEVDAILQQYPNATGWLPVTSLDFNMVMLIEDDNTMHIVDLRPGV